ncbi:MAG: hypothetical protein KGQ37_05230 [Hyphomicrobiales bacterium]|nr:hypothetical protein [Hyphomicrobiales bacterium]
MMAMHLIVLLIAVAISVIPFWKIFPRAGWQSPMAMFMAVPLVNIVVLYVLAFKKWPGDPL